MEGSDETTTSSESITLKNLFTEAMHLYETIENGKESTNSDTVQMTIRHAIAKFEKATNLVSYSGMFSKNESIEELPTETLQYLLLPALLGTLTLKLCGRHRKDLINAAEVYFRDFLQRCKDYGVTEVDIPQPSDNSELNPGEMAQSEQAKITAMVLSREAKIKRYKQAKELKDRLNDLSQMMMKPTSDEQTKRDYFLVLLQSYVTQALDELVSIDQEKPLLEYMEKHAGEKKPREERPQPLKPVIITRDAVQKAVFGLGYPSVPSMTIEEFYDNRVKEGLFPGSCTSVPRVATETSEDELTEAEKEKMEQLVEGDDPDELERQRKMDEYKDDHRRGWGNRYNRS